MRTKSWAIALMALCTLLTATGQVFFKTGASKLEPNLLALLTNIPLLIGLVIYLLGAVLVVFTLGHGELSVLYPVLATAYIWVSFLSMFFFNETMSGLKWMGVFAIIAGITCIGVGGRR